jgi:hypothetical protein
MMIKIRVILAAVHKTVPQEFISKPGILYRVTTRVSDSDPRRAIMTQQKNVHYNAAGVPPADAPRGFDAAQP